MMNIAKILKDYPSGTVLYCPIYGELSLLDVQLGQTYPICCRVIKSGSFMDFTEDGKICTTDAEPTLFPSRTQRDWSKFGMTNQVTDQENKPQFEPFDKVLVRDSDSEMWKPAFFAVLKADDEYKFGIIDLVVPAFYRQCIPYNDDTKHLLGTYDNYKPKAQ